MKAARPVRKGADGKVLRATGVTRRRPTLQVTNPKTEETLTVLEAGNALEPVVLRAMERAGWEVTPADPQDPQQVSVQVGPNMVVTGHPDATGVLPLFGGEAVVEVKTRGPEAFKRWRTLGAERSHPASVAQAAFYTLGTFGELRDAVIATMDTGSRQWDYEVIPAERVGQALERASEWLGQLGAHLVLNGPDPDVLPERDYSVTDWQCKSCPFLNVCLPGMAAEAEGEPEPAEDAEPKEPVTDEEARNALHEYEEIQDTIREFEDEKKWVVEKLGIWLGQQGVKKAKLAYFRSSLRSWYDYPLSPRESRLIENLYVKRRHLDGTCHHPLRRLRQAVQPTSKGVPAMVLDRALVDGPDADKPSRALS